MTLELKQAEQFARQAHGSINQKRKSGEDYIVHPLAVRDIIKTVVTDEEMIAAALLHDVLEDVYPLNNYYSYDTIRKLFGEHVAVLVLELTNIYTKARFPHLNRRQRKHLENERVAKTSPKAKTIKLADIIHNLQTVHNIGNFAEIYIAEKKEQLIFLKDGHGVLWNNAKEALDLFSR
jgi:(p)ppGpp synthase/HD superfamily hydrolase